MNRKLLPLSILVGLGIATSAVQAEENLDQSGWWVSAAAGITTADGKSISGHRDKTPSPKLELGYNFNQYFGLYTGYDYVHRLGIDKLHMGSIGVRGQYQLIDNLSIFGKLGGTYIYSDIRSSNVKQDSSTVSAGLGLEYQLTNAVSTKVGYEYYDSLDVENGEDAHLHQVYWGMTYKFGQPATPRVITQEIIQERVVEVPVEVAVSQPVRTEFILPFKIGKSNLEGLPAFYLDEIVEVMQNNPELVAYVVGRTDSSGSKTINNQISAQRAQVVANYLEQQGIDADRIKISAVADSRPLTEGNVDIERSAQVILK